MKRRLLATMLFLLLGAGLNVGVAWACALWVDPLATSQKCVELVRTQDGPLYVVTGRALGASVILREVVRSVYPSPLLPDASRLEIDAWARELGWQAIRDHSTAPRWSRPASSWSPTGKAPCYITDARGWPLRSLVGAAQLQRSSVDSPSALYWAVKLPGGQGRERPQYPRLLPLRPIALGLVANTAFYAVATWLLYRVFVGLRRFIRRERGLCPACAYPRGQSDVCSECGHSNLDV